MIQGTCIRAYATLCGRLIAEDSKPVTNHPAPPTAQRAPAVRTLPSMGVFVVPCTLFIGSSPQMPRSPGGLANCLEDHPKSQSCQWLGAFACIHRAAEKGGSRKLTDIVAQERVEMPLPRAPDMFLYHITFLPRC